MLKSKNSPTNIEYQKKKSMLLKEKNSIDSKLRIYHETQKSITLRNFNSPIIDNNILKEINKKSFSKSKEHKNENILLPPINKNNILIQIIKRIIIKLMN